MNLFPPGSMNSNKTKENPELCRFISSMDTQDRLDPRDSFFSGRWNAGKIYATSKMVNKSDVRTSHSYTDFTFLYPTVNKYEIF